VVGPGVILERARCGTARVPWTQIQR